MFILNIYIFSLFFGGILCVVLSRYHLLVILLSLEFLIVGVFLALMDSLSRGLSSSFLIILYLFVVVCEGRLGLGILVSLVRGYGGELCNPLNLLKC